ncbi:MAG: hypothetical protein CMI09_04710 [Oceanospirillaceae bacterium]|nr:hypothetical protein [Oceanospirillaceae bacterium]|tara:strand:+ start:3364 stop:3654 length:291 start_codon:yes stop_codon:yes gene_type:complete
MPWFINAFFAIYIGFALFLLLRTLWLASSSERIDTYLRESKKGQKWLEQYGYDKSLAMFKKIGIPVGIIAPILFIGVGIGMYMLIYQAISSGQAQF